MREIFILFITTRKIDRNAITKARENGKSYRVEDVFLNEPDGSISYGFAKVSYPSNRHRADQNHPLISDQENPIFNFSVIDHSVVQTPEQFLTLAKRLFPSSGLKALLYIHGIDNSFSDASGRLAQLAADIKEKKIPVLFSWPSDNARYFRGVPLFAPSEATYKKLVGIAQASRPYLARAITDVASISGGSYDILAHSAGTEIAANAMALRNRKNPLHSRDPSVAVPALVLAAPDISTQQFDSDLRTKIVDLTRGITIYCSDDLALHLSKQYNRSDERLGYCLTTKTLRGVEMVRVIGARDFARHSYYLQSTELIDDIESVTSAPREKIEPSRQITIRR